MLNGKIIILFITGIIIAIFLGISFNKASPDTPISQCADLDVEGETYTLSDSFVNNTFGTFCIHIKAPDITFDCNGYLINSSQTSGFLIHTETNATIKNCQLDIEPTGTGMGINANYTSNLTINNITCYDSRYCLYLLRVSDSDIYDIKTYNNMTELAGGGQNSFRLTGLDNNISNLNFNGGHDGIQMVAPAGNNTLTNLTFYYVNQQANSDCFVIVGSNNISNVNFTNCSRTIISTQSPVNLNKIYDGIFQDGKINSYRYTNNVLRLINISYSNFIEMGTIDAQVYRDWYFQTQISNNVTYLQNANVSIYNSTNSLIYSELTDANGQITRQDLSEYLNTTGTYFNNYTINVTKAGYTPSSQSYNLTIEQNILHEITLESPCEDSFCLFDSSQDLADIYYQSNPSLGVYNFGGQIKWDIITFNDLGINCNQVDTAILQLYISSKIGSPDNDFRAWTIANQDWDESSGAIIIEGQDRYNQSNGIMTSTTAGTYTNFTITDQFQYACQEGYDNFTIRFEDVDALTSTTIDTVADNPIKMGADTKNDFIYTFSDRENGTSAYRPVLTINYTTVVPVNLRINATQPIANQSFVTTTINFTCNITSNENIDNITLNVFYPNETLFYTEINNTDLTTPNGLNVSFIDVSVPIDNRSDPYLYNCTAYDVNSNVNYTNTIPFYRYNQSQPTIEMNVLSNEQYYFQNDTFNVSSDYNISWKPYTVQCKFFDEYGLKEVWLDNNESVGIGKLFALNSTVFTYPYPTEYTINYTLTNTDRDDPEGAGNGWQDIYEQYLWNCRADSLGENFSYYNDTTNVTITMNITPELYVVHVVDTETNNLASNCFDCDINTTNYDIGNNTWNAFYNDSSGDYYANFRNQSDNFSRHPIITWFDMTTLLYWYANNSPSNDPIYYTFDGNYSNEINFFNDTMEFHYHNFQWYNYTRYWEDGTPFINQPYLPANAWNQVRIWDNTTSLGINTTGEANPQEVIEMVFSNRIIEEQQFPGVFRSGWLFVDTNLSNWLEGIVKYSYNILYDANNSGYYDPEPLGNIYDWEGLETNDSWEGYHPNETNYRLKGDLNRLELPCQPGEQNIAKIQNATQKAYDGHRVILCNYDHNYGVIDLIPTSLTNTYNNLVTVQGTSAYEDMRFKYTNALEAAQWYDYCTDTTSPTLVITENATDYLIESDEELFAFPYLAINTTEGTFVRGTVHNLSSTTWYANKTEYPVNNFLFAATDKCGNTFVQNVVGEGLIITNPTESSPETVSFPQNLTVSFQFVEDSEYQTTGVSIENITLEDEGGQYDCPLDGTVIYSGSFIFKQNCSVPDISGGYYNLTVVGNTSTSGFEIGKQNNSVFYSLCVCPLIGDCTLNMSLYCNITEPMNISGILNFTGTYGYVNISTEVNATQLIFPPEGTILFAFKNPNGYIRIISFILLILTLPIQSIRFSKKTHQNGLK